MVATLLLGQVKSVNQKGLSEVFNHLVANILIFMNVHDQSNIMNELIQEGHVITKEQAACLAPYRKDNINRFGAYFLDELREKMAINYGLPVVFLSN